MGCDDEKLSKYLTHTFMAHCHTMICQQVTLSGEAEWPKVADAVIEAGVQQYMGRHTTMQRGYPGMVERHGARTERRQNTVRPHPRAKGGVQWQRGFRLF